jgi:SAM-dependent methyltransferase
VKPIDDLPERPRWLPPEAEVRRLLAGSALYPFYRLKLTDYVSRLLPPQGPCSLLDVGAGDGSLGAALQAFRPGTTVVGLEVALRTATRPGVRMVRFDGRRIPFADGSFDVALLSNVLHHAGDPLALLIEVRRVARKRIIIKDHLTRGALDDAKLAFLDVLGNLRFGAQVSAKYLSQERWSKLFAAVPGATARTYQGLPFRAGLLEMVFGNRLEVIFSLELTA